MQLCQLPALLLLLILVCFPPNARASLDNYGLDDWTPTDVQRWFRSHGFLVELKSLEDLGVDGKFALDLTDDELLKLGVLAAQHFKYREKASSTLRAIHDKPKDLFEFRATNLRLCQFWIGPAIALSDWGLLWARFFDTHPVIEWHNNEIDETPLLQFCLTWLVAPSYPFYQIAKKMDSKHSFIDDALVYSLLLAVVSQVCNFARMFIEPVKTLTTRVKVAAFGLAFSTLSYYVFWWMSPRFVLDIIFYLQVYVFIPASVIAQFISIVFAFIGSVVALCKIKSD